LAIEDNSAGLEHIQASHQDMNAATECDLAPAAAAWEAQIVSVYGRANPSVVNITSRGIVNAFRQIAPQEGTGSGFVYDDEGHIVTNYHVVEGAQELLVTLTTGETLEARLVGADAANDLAILHVDAQGDLPAPLTLADSDQLQVGQTTIAIGNPFGLEGTLTTGVVSALRRVIESPQDQRFIGEVIQTDAATNPGNSGGPLLDLQGRVIGINSQIVSASGSSSGVGFAISSNTIARVVPELVATGNYRHPWLGVKLLPLSSRTSAAIRDTGVSVPVESGLLIIDIVPGSPAEKAGLSGGGTVHRVGNYDLPLGGDVITAINGETVTSYEDLTVYLETETSVGDTVQLTAFIDGAERTLEVTLEERPGA
jgi:S1-C subfamily serine protease